MNRIGKLIFLAGLIGMLLGGAIGGYMIATAKTVTLISPHAPSVVSLNKSMYQKGDEVAEIYGNPLEKKTQLVMLDPKRVIRPEEDPSLILYPVDKQKGENPLQVQSVWLFTRSALGGFLVVAVIGLVLMKRKRR